MLNCTALTLPCGVPGLSGVLQVMAASNLLAAQQQQETFSCMYGQQQQLVQPDVLDTEPTLLLCDVTADGITHQAYQQQAELTLAQQRPARPPAAEAHPSKAAPAAASRARGPAAAAVLGRGLPSLRHVESKIKQSVAASRQKAAAQQQQRQRLLSSVVATSSSHRPGQQQQQPKAAALEEACPPAATAEQFISNPWTSWFVPGAPADMSMPAAAAAAAAVAAQGGSSSDDGCSSIGEEVVTEASQLQHSQGPCPVVAADVAASRGALQDITSGLNQLECSSSDGNATSKPPPPVETWGLSADTFTFAGGDPSQQHAGSRQQDLQNTAIAATGNLVWPSGQPQQQQQQRAWAADFGHLESAQLDVAVQQAAAAGAKRRAGPHQQRQQWRQRWVGDYGHLEG
jgi:hypothetical protein